MTKSQSVRMIGAARHLYKESERDDSSEFFFIDSVIIKIRNELQSNC